MDIDQLLRAMVEFRASDLHLQADSPPSLRIDGTLSPLKAPPLSADHIGRLVEEAVGEAHRQR